MKIPFFKPDVKIKKLGCDDSTARLNLWKKMYEKARNCPNCRALPISVEAVEIENDDGTTKYKSTCTICGLMWETYIR